LGALHRRGGTRQGNGVAEDPLVQVDLAQAAVVRRQADRTPLPATNRAVKLEVQITDAQPMTRVVGGVIADPGPQAERVTGSQVDARLLEPHDSATGPDEPQVKIAVGA